MAFFIVTAVKTSNLTSVKRFEKLHNEALHNIYSSWSHGLVVKQLPATRMATQKLGYL
jgi:hypothetical protein